METEPTECDHDFAKTDEDFDLGSDEFVRYDAKTDKFYYVRKMAKLHECVKCGIELVLDEPRLERVDLNPKL